MDKWTLVWFRKDLRIEDNLALKEALEIGQPILALFVLEDFEKWQLGGASKWWLHHALEKLDQELSDHRVQLVLAKGSAEDIIFDLLKKHPISHLVWNRRYDQQGIEVDSLIKKRAKENDISAKSYNSLLLFEPHAIKNKSGEPYRVFTPFWKAVSAKDIPSPVKIDWRKRPNQNPDIESISLSDLQLLPDLDWDSGFTDFWKLDQYPLEIAKRFLSDQVNDYKDARDLPAQNGTSTLSPYLHWGQIGPRQVLALASEQYSTDGLKTFLSEIGWREFAYHLLYHFPETPDQALYQKYRDFPWEPNQKFLTAWKHGQTGYPIVDAGMRQLWQTGWMHNRVRMIVASFLVKHLLQPWQEGAKWFWDTLVDADLASNTLGWQWSAGCGADAAPYFRIFNPMTQGDKFDKEGEYIKQFCPELKKLPKKFINTPWEAPKEILNHAGVELGKNYPYPIVDHKEAREKALAAFDKVKS